MVAILGVRVEVENILHYWQGGVAEIHCCALMEIYAFIQQVGRAVRATVTSMEAIYILC